MDGPDVTGLTVLFCFYSLPYLSKYSGLFGVFAFNWVKYYTAKVNRLPGVITNMISPLSVPVGWYG